jgi:putative acetyltransferase
MPQGIPMQIRLLDPETEEAQELITFSDQYMESLYPSESNHLESLTALKASNVAFFGGYIDGKLIACGATKILDDDGRYGEIKRVFVIEGFRGQGLSKALIVHLEHHLRNSNINLARLETGVKQSEALGLYGRLGYVVRGPFGSYREDPLSVFMEKTLAV